MAANLVSESESEPDRRGRGTSTSGMKRLGALEMATWARVTITDFNPLP